VADLLLDPAVPEVRPATAGCRFCRAPLVETVVDLGMSPLCESFLTLEECNRMEAFYPLHLQVCGQCFLVQLQQYVTPEQIFREYAYFSSFSTSWVEHARRYCEEMTVRQGLGPDHLVVELASNDGYLLQHFVALGVPVLGIEPARNVARAAEARGVPTVTEFFGTAMARGLVAGGRQADLLVANNVLAQVPDLVDFVAGMALLLAPDGLATVEFPHLARLIDGNQFDTIYHEHFSYFSGLSAQRIFASQGLRLVDVERLGTHGGSLRFHLRHADRAGSPSPAVETLLREERAAGFDRLAGYRQFAPAVERVKRQLLRFLIDAKDSGASVVGYGAPGKGNTLLNYCGIRADLLAYTVDRNPYKHGRYLPGTHIPVFPPARIFETRPDYVLILPWNLRNEIVAQLGGITEWGGRFVVPVPEVTLL
jgi:hypothetical protein